MTKYPTDQSSHAVPNDYGGCHEFDSQVAFNLFLEEAREHAKEVNFQSPDEGGKKRLKSKKSWGHAFFSWWKTEKKRHPNTSPANHAQPCKPSKVFLSGPIGRSRSRKGETGFRRRPSSGPLAQLLDSTRNGESEVPYMSLHRLNSPNQVKGYGPVYFVT